jgi:hypothetical protein
MDKPQRAAGQVIQQFTGACRQQVVATSLLLLLLMLIITACAMSRAAPSKAPGEGSSAPLAPVTVVSTGRDSREQRAGPVANPTVFAAVESPTVLPEERFTLALAELPTQVGVNWRMWQPQGVRPLVAVGTHGILWVRFPALVTNAATEEWGLHPHPAGDFTVLYTRLRAEGGDLAQGAQPVMHLQGRIYDQNYGLEMDQRPTMLDAVADDHFLLRTYALPDGAQNGGPERIMLLDPLNGTVTEIASGSNGGGRFFTVAHNYRWLFWNRYAIDPSGAGMTDVAAGLVDLQTGQERDVHLGGENWTADVTWQADGKLHFQRGRDDGWYVLDPETDTVVPAGGQ